MSEETNKNQQPQERPIQERQYDSNTNRDRIDEGLGRGKSNPLSWQPTKDQTDTNPPDSGSGVGDSE